MATSQLSDGRIAVLAYEAGFRGDALATAVAVALAESSGNPRAHNAVPPDNSYGLWQINMLGALGTDRRSRYSLPSNDALFDPATNARAAFDISGGGTNWRPWTTYTSGAYRQYLDRAEKATDPKSWGDVITDLPGAVVDKATDTLGDALGAAVEPFVAGLRRLTIIGAVVVAGVALVVAGAWRGVKSASG